MIPFLLIGGFWAEGKWIRAMVSVMTQDGLSGNSLVSVNSCKVCICYDVHIKHSLLGKTNTVVFESALLKGVWCLKLVTVLEHIMKSDVYASNKTMSISQ